MLNDKIVKICEQKFTYLNYSNRTKNVYLHYIKEFVRYCGDKRVTHINSNVFQSYLDNYTFTSVSQQNQVICQKKKQPKPLSFTRSKLTPEPLLMRVYLGFHF